MNPFTGVMASSPIGEVFDFSSSVRDGWVLIPGSPERSREFFGESVSAMLQARNRPMESFDGIIPSPGIGVPRHAGRATIRNRM